MTLVGLSINNCFLETEPLKNWVQQQIIDRDYLQNTQYMVLRNRPTLSIDTERLACLNSPPGVQLGTLA